jgi:2-keto-4-pentenoate hydratase/2-oxohepta-3-ene-1,7-dioic acid hydratase in catechol pathway
MKIARYRINSTAEAGYGVIEGESILPLPAGPFAPSLEPDREPIALSAVTLLAPCEPTKVVAGGTNYHGHVREMNLKLPTVPVFFLKPPSSVIGSGAGIEYPPETSRLEYEAELAVVIGREMRRAAPEDVRSGILGFTCVNDVTARDIQAWGGNFIHLCHSKSFDTFCPTGPWIETEFDARDADMTLTVNGEVRQQTNTSDMIFTVEKMVSYFSHVMTLLPGDLVLTGTPAGVGQMQVGDVVELTIEGIGTLRNEIVRAAV